MLFLICTKRFFVQPWYTIPDPSDSSRRLLCKGWACNVKGYHQHQIDEFQDIIGRYLNESQDISIKKNISNLIQRGFHPGLCAAGFFSMIGLAGFEQNLTKSHELLTNGSNNGIWSCLDALSFHPFTRNNSTNIGLAASMGGVWSMIKYSIQNYEKNNTMSLNMLRHLATSATTGWWKKRRSGEKFSNLVSVILGLKSGHLSDTWKEMISLEEEGHLPAALWVAEGYYTGEIGTIDLKKAYDTILPYVINGPWKIDLSAVLESEDDFDKKIMYSISSDMGDKSADALVSFKQFV